jgi:metallo-beta-lactamase class B
MAFPAVKGVRTVRDGETLNVGPLAITAHDTPGHTPGSTTWTWRSCEGARCLDIVYVDSVTAISAPGFRYLGSGAGPAPADAFRRSLATIAALPCDILLAPHPGAVGLDEKRRRLRIGSRANPFVDGNACRAYAAEGARGLDRRLAEERAAPAVTPSP